MELIVELLTITLITSAGAGEEPAPYHTFPTPPEKAALAFWVEPEGERTEDNSNAVEGVWKRLAACESGRGGEPTWDYDSTRYNWGNGLFDGGLQFTERTWNAFKPDEYPEYAYLATPSQQVNVGKAVARAQGAGAWPSCTAKLGISTEDLLQ